MLVKYRLRFGLYWLYQLNTGLLKFYLIDGFIRLENLVY